MSILDDAIREHLDLKRAHGADAAELKKLEDEAFGPPQRPDEIEPFAEAPTEFLGVPEGSAEAGTMVAEPGGRRVPNIADLQEPPEPPAPVEEPQAEAPTPVPEAEAPPAPEAPAVEEQPAMEHETIPEPAAEAEAPPADAAPSTEERHAIAEQPTEFFDVEAEMEEAPPATEAPSPSDEQLAEAEASEPRLATPPPVPAPAPAPAPEPEVADEAPSEEYEEDDFFSEQRLSDELDQALEAPVTDEHEIVEETEEEEEPISEEYEDDEFETGEEEHPPPAAPRGQESEDVREGTPEFLEDGEDDDLWFEQRPPKDFDFDD
jgi:hypothetical protein